MTDDNCSFCGSLYEFRELQRRDGCRLYLCPFCAELYDLNPKLFEAKLEFRKIENKLREQGVLEKVISVNLPDGSALKIHWFEFMNIQQKLLNNMIKGGYVYA